MRINQRIPIVVSFAVLSGLVANSAFACGEVMSRMGSALRYQAFITRHPAHVLLFGTPQDRATASDRAQFRRSLEKAGHHVTVVDSVAGLDKALAAGTYDIIITGAGNIASVNSALAGANRHTTLIPVLGPGQDATLEATYPLAVHADADLNRYLKSIEIGMRARGT